MNPTVQEVAIEMETAQRFVEDNKALQRLMMNADFKRLIVKGFANEEAVRLVNFRASDEAQENPALLQRIDRGIDAIGYLQEHFRKIELLGDQAESTMQNMREEGLV